MTKNQTEKYLTEMKELPDYENQTEKPFMPEKDSSVKSKSTKIVEAKVEAKPAIKNVNVITLKTKAKENKAKSGVDEDEETKETTLPKEKRVSIKNYSAKDIILGVINLLAIVFLIILLTKLPEKGEELKNIKNELMQSQSGASFNDKEIEASLLRVDELNALFIDETRVFEFASELDKLKATTKIAEWSFATQKPVKDKTGNEGLPVIITLRGDSVEELLVDLPKIRSLPYVFRPISIDAAPTLNQNNEGQSLVELKYGILLYVNENSD